MDNILYKVTDNNSIIEIGKRILAYDPFESCESLDRERLSIQLYIMAKYVTSNIKYPFSVYKHESPDFIFCDKDEQPITGIEHVRATSEAYQMATTEFHRKGDYFCIEPSHYRFGTRPTKSNAQRGLKHNDDELTGEPEYGDFTEREWCRFTIKALEDKTALYTKEHYLKLSSNELIIEDDTPLDFLNLDRAIQYLKECITSCANPFSAIHIFSKHSFILNANLNPILIDVSKKNIKCIIDHI